MFENYLDRIIKIIKGEDFDNTSDLKVFSSLDTLEDKQKDMIDEKKETNSQEKFHMVSYPGLYKSSIDYQYNHSQYYSSYYYNNNNDHHQQYQQYSYDINNGLSYNGDHYQQQYHHQQHNQHHNYPKHNPYQENYHHHQFYNQHQQYQQHQQNGYYKCNT